MRWWTAEGELLPWASEMIEEKDQALQAKDQALQEKDQALQEKDQALSDLRDREQQLLELSRSQGLDPETHS